VGEVEALAWKEQAKEVTDTRYPLTKDIYNLPSLCPGGSKVIPSDFLKT